MSWQPIETAPKNATDVLVLLHDSVGLPYVMVAHWAEDLSGSEQPPFRGWFYNTGYGFSEVPKKPKRWHPLPELPPS